MLCYSKLGWIDISGSCQAALHRPQNVDSCADQQTLSVYKPAKAVFTALFVPGQITHIL
jgi:hypothetical protein